LYDDAAGKASVIVAQTQKSGKMFKLPLAVDVYDGATSKRINFIAQNKVDTFVIPYKTKPDLINVDADKLLLAEKTDNKTESNYIYQFKYAKNYMDRKEAIDAFAKKTMPELAQGLNDKFGGLKILTMQKLGTSPYKADKEVLAQIEGLVKSSNKKVKAAAINYLVKNGDKKYLSIYQASVSDSSYRVAGAALKGIVALDSANAYTLAKKYSNDAKGALGEVVNSVLISMGTEADFEFVSKLYNDAPLSQEKVAATAKFASYLAKLNDLAKVKKGIDNIVSFRNAIPEQFRSFVDASFKKSLAVVSAAKGSEIETYITNAFK
jgi:aminopeptidase N